MLHVFEGVPDSGARMLETNKPSSLSAPIFELERERQVMSKKRSTATSVSALLKNCDTVYEVLSFHWRKSDCLSINKLHSRLSSAFMLERQK